MLPFLFFAGLRAVVLAGGEGGRVVVGAHPTLSPFTMAHLGTDEESFLYTRWVRP